MTLPTTHAELRVYSVGNESTARQDADLVLTPATGLEEAQLKQRLQSWSDPAKFKFDGTDHDYNGKITPGDRLEFIVRVAPGAQANEPGRYGLARYGLGASAGGTTTTKRRWTGWAHSPNFEATGAGHIEWTLEADDFVFETLRNRRAYGAFETASISGSEDSILNTLLRNQAPEINRDQVFSVGKVTDIEFGGKTLFEAVKELAEEGDAAMASNGRSLVFRPIDDLDPIGQLTPKDFGTLSSDQNTDGMINRLRINGGTGIDIDEQTGTSDDLDHYRTVTQDNPVTFRLEPEKHRLDKASVWTRATGSGEDFRVRIQGPNADNTGPRDPSETNKDIESDASSAEFLADGGWRDRWRFTHEPLPDTPWLIIDTPGNNGQEVGMNANGDPLIKTYYPYEVTVRVEDKISQTRYRRRDEEINRDSLNTFAAARNLGEAKLRHSTTPEDKYSFDAQSWKAHSLAPGGVIVVDYPDLGLSGHYIVDERADHYGGRSANLLDTDVTIQAIDTL